MPLYTERATAPDGVRHSRSFKNAEELREQGPIWKKLVKEGKIKNRKEIPKKEQEEKIEVLRDLDLDLDVDTGNTTVIYGSSKRGKSSLLMYLYKKYYVDYISLLFGDNLQKDLYKDPYKKLIKINTFTPDLIEMTKIINGKTKNKYPFVILLDDIIDQKMNKILMKLILSYRNSNISSVVSLQNVMLFKKENRTNVNNIIFFGFNEDKDIEDVIKRYFNSYLKKMKMDEKISWYKEQTADHKFIYYNPRKSMFTFHKLKLSDI